MFVSFINRNTGMDVAFDSAEVKIVQKAVYLVGVYNDVRYGTDVTLRDGTVFPLLDQYDTVVNVMRTGSPIALPAGDQS